MQTAQQTAPFNALKVGKGHRTYRDYRPLTAAEWLDPTVNACILAAHQQRGGWALLEEPLICNGGLCVADGASENGRRMHDSDGADINLVCPRNSIDRLGQSQRRICR